MKRIEGESIVLRDLMPSDAAGYAALSQGQDAADCLPAPCEQVVPDAREQAAHTDFYGQFHRVVDSLAPAFGQLSGAAR